MESTLNADGKQAHEKMLNAANHQGNANQNHSEISLHTCQNGYYQKRQEIASVGKDVEKGTLEHCWWEGKLVPLL